MSIVAVRLHHLVAPLPEVIGNALVSFDRRETLFVEIVDRHGRSGWGEAWHTPAADRATIAAGLAPRLLGQDPQQIGRLWQEMREATGGAMGAGAALDMALHDLAARQRGIPVSTLLGGALRNRVPALRSGGAAGGYPFLEFDAGPNPLLDLCGRPAVNNDRTVMVPDGPGFRHRSECRDAVTLRRRPAGRDGTIVPRVRLIGVVGQAGWFRQRFIQKKAAVGSGVPLTA